MYEVAFNVKYEGFLALFFVLPGLAFIALFLLIIRFREKLVSWNILVLGKPATTKSIAISASVLLIFSVLCTGSSAFSLGSKTLSLISSYDRGSYFVVEGYVEDFNSMPYTGRQRETFSVNGIRFSYSDSIVTPAFNNTASHGGPIREGKYVRISYIDNDIIKLELRK
ncbi:hypothetical protein RN22_04565 [Grimontia sp. AD028]|uniref:hypothetical protein n=1 Tax=Grimontia sp. AD028 TaxID=1581149 RepID=UPI00061AB9AD|nr:hypothetical protein [Grimontia sp. AD028]KKD61633.1 hypothetical protein RN22_04565 [Grimontia sp. AD028]